MVIFEENFKWHLEAFASELFICFSPLIKTYICNLMVMLKCQ